MIICYHFPSVALYSWRYFKVSGRIFLQSSENDIEYIRQ